MKRGEVVVDKYGRATGLAEKAREIMENDRDGQYGYSDDSDDLADIFSQARIC